MLLKQNTTTGFALQCFLSTVGWHQQGHTAGKKDSACLNKIKTFRE